MRAILAAELEIAVCRPTLASAEREEISMLTSRQCCTDQRGEQGASGVAVLLHIDCYSGGDVRGFEPALEIVVVEEIVAAEYYLRESMGQLVVEHQAETQARPMLHCRPLHLSPG